MKRREISIGKTSCTNQFQGFLLNLALVKYCQQEQRDWLDHSHRGGFTIWAARSFFITVNNYTTKEWKRVDAQLDHGVWSNNNAEFPPEVLPPVHLDDNGAVPGIIYFSSESNGVATGTEGSTTCSSDRGDIRIYWDNPYIGSNSFSVTVPTDYKADYGDFSGNNANVVVTIKHI